MKLLKPTLLVALTSLSGAALADFVINDDLITDGSACIGFDCVNGESFGFDTIKLKENNLRIKFDDTSAAAAFPANDWQLTANDSANGGVSHFTITDVTANRNPFRVEAGAPNNSLLIEDSGDIGIGTNNPALELHVLDGDSPALRLAQDGSSGFTPQTWDMAGNETNFFIRDVTNGSTLPFRIRPDSDTDALTINGDNVGVGTISPSSSLHVRDTDGATKLLVEEASGTAAARTLLELKNNGNTKFSMTNTDAGDEWSFANPGTGMRISLQGSGDVEFDLLNNGDLEIAGVLTENSDRNAKTNIVSVDQQAILDKVKALPLSQWQYKDAVGANHIGPMAQDFYAAFGLGKTDTGISTLDTSGVALVSIQALAAENEQLKAAHRELLNAYHQQQAQLQQQHQQQVSLESRLEAKLDAQQQTIVQLQTLLAEQLKQQSGASVLTALD